MSGFPALGFGHEAEAEKTHELQADVARDVVEGWKV